MEFELPEELTLLQQTVRRFVDNELIPLEGKSLDNGRLKPDIEAQLTARCRELGLWQIDVPEDYGGQGLGLLACSVIWAELGRTVALPTRGHRILGPEVRPVLYRLEGEMREKYLFPSMRGEITSCFAQTEPDAGSDPGSMRTTAVRDGDHYVINGVKRFITGADNADFIILMAATDREKGSRGGISCFIVDRDTPGIRLTTAYETMTEEHPWEIVFEDVRVPAGHLVGEEGKGFRARAEVADHRAGETGLAGAWRDAAVPGAGSQLCAPAGDVRAANRRQAGDLVPAGRCLCAARSSRTAGAARGGQIRRRRR